MQQAKVLVQHETGLHARPATQFVKTAKQFSSDITITCKGKTVSAKSIVLLLTMGISKGTEIEVTANGEDEQAAVTTLIELIEHNFPE